MERRRFSLEVEGLTLAGQVYVPDTSPCSALCLCHGIPRGTPNAADGGYSVLAERFCEAGFLTLIFNFRGTGNSGGNFDILGWTRDLEAVLDYLHSTAAAPGEGIAVMGSSAGAAVSVYVASQDPRVSLLVTCACPAQFRIPAEAGGAENVVEHFRQVGIIRDADFPPSPSEWLDGFGRLDPSGRIDKLSPRPLLIIHGAEDDVIDPRDARTLYDRAREPKDILIIEGAGHRLRLSEEAMDGALKWLTAHLQGD